MLDGGNSGRTLIGRCELIDVLGSGRTASVYRAYDHIVGRLVAAKLYRSDVHQTPEAVAGRARELRLRFDHPNLVATLDAFRDGETTVVLSELFEYGSLDHLIPIAPAAVASWAATMVTDVLAGLQVLHDRGLVHGDLHPGNVLVTRDGDGGLRFAISDFATVGGTESGSRGTVGALAPELRDGRAPDERSDLYAVGLIAAAAMRAPSVEAGDPSVADVIAALTAERPDDRPASAEQALGLVPTTGATLTSLDRLLPPAVSPLAPDWQPTPLGRRSRPRFDPRPALPMVARERELAHLRQQWTHALHGAGTISLLVGEGGVGKSRLVSEFVALVAPNALVLEARATEGGTAFSLWTSLIGDAISALGSDTILARTGASASVLAGFDDRLAAAGRHPRTPTADERRLALDALVRAATREGAATIVLEDLHFVSTEDIDVLVTLARSVVDLPVLIVATTRTEPELHGILDGLVDVIELTALNDREVALVAASVAEVTDPVQLESIVRRSGGNPYLVVELSRALAEDPDAGVPESVAAALQARIDELGADARTVLEFAATLGTDFDVEVIAAATEFSLAATANALGRAEQGRVVAPTDAGATGFRFAHDLTREALVAATEPAEQKRRHRLLAHALLAARSDDPTALLNAADHLIMAADPLARKEALDVLQRARSLALATQAIDVAESAGTAAFDLAYENADPGVVQLGFECGDLSERLGHLDAAISVFSRACRVAENAIDRAELHRRLGYALEKAGSYDGSLTEYKQAELALADGGDDRNVRTRVTVALGMAVTHFYRGAFADSRELSLDGLTRAESCGDERLVAQACLQLEMVSSELGLPDREIWAERARELLTRLDDPVALGNLLLNSGVSRYNDGQWSAALATYRGAIEAFESADDVVGAAIARNNEAETLTGQGRYRDARWRLLGAQQVFVTTGYCMGEALATSGLSRVMLHTGRIEEAERLLGRALNLVRDLEATNFVYDTRVREVEVLMYSGARDRALATVGEARELGRRVGDVAIVPITLQRLEGLINWMCGRPEVARGLLNEAESRARGEKIPAELSLALHALIETGIRSDDATRAELEAVNAGLGVVWLPPLPVAPG